MTHAVSDSALVVVTATLTPERTMSLLQSAFDSFPPEIGIITVGEEIRSAAPGTPPQPPATAPVPVATVANPENVGRLGTLLNLYLQEWGEQTAVAVASLTSLIDHASKPALFRVLHPLTTHLRSIDATGHFFVDPAIVGTTTVNTIEPLFDDVVDDRQTVAARQPEQDAPDDVLAAPIRQWIVTYLCEQSDPVAIRTLADRLVNQKDRTEDLVRLQP